MSSTFTQHEREVLFYCRDKRRLYIVILLFLFAIATSLIVASIYFLLKAETVYIAGAVSGVACFLLLIQYAFQKYRRYAIVWENYLHELWYCDESISNILDEISNSDNSIDFGKEQALQEKTAAAKEKNRSKDIATSASWTASPKNNNGDPELRKFHHLWVTTDDAGEKILLNTDYGVPAEYAGKYIPKHINSTSSRKLKYYGDFYYDGNLFSAYIKAHSLREAVTVSEEYGCQLLSITACDKLNYNVNFVYPYLPCTITTKELKDGFRLNRKQIEKIRSLIKRPKHTSCEIDKRHSFNPRGGELNPLSGIKDQKILGSLSSGNDASINIRSFIEYCSCEIRKSFEAVNKKHTSSNDFSSCQNSSTNNKDEVPVSMPVLSSEEKLIQMEKFKRAPSIFRVTPDNLYQKCYDVKSFNKGGILKLTAGIYFDIFLNDFQDPIFELAYTVLFKCIAAGYNGIRLDGHVLDHLNESSPSEYLYVLNNGELVRDKSLGNPNLKEFNKTSKLILVWMGVLPDTIEGVFRQKIAINGKEYEFKTELRLMNYGQTILCQWRQVS